MFTNDGCREAVEFADASWTSGGRKLLLGHVGKEVPAWRGEKKAAAVGKSWRIRWRERRRSGTQSANESGLRWLVDMSAMEGCNPVAVKVGTGRHGQWGRLPGSKRPRLRVADDPMRIPQRTWTPVAPATRT